MSQQTNKQLCTLMETNVLSLAAAIQRAHGMVGHHLSEATVSELLAILAANNIELRCTYLGDVND